MKSHKIIEIGNKWKLHDFLVTHVPEHSIMFR